MTVQFNGGGRMPTPDATNPLWGGTFPSFTQLSAQVTRRFRRWSIYAGGENLTNFKQDNPVISADNPYSRNFDATMVWGRLWVTSSMPESVITYRNYKLQKQTLQ